MMKKYRFKVIIGNTIRILSIGITRVNIKYKDVVNKRYVYLELRHRKVYAAFSYSLYCFVYSITSIEDVNIFNIKLEDKILGGRMKSFYINIDNSQPIAKKFDSKELYNIFAYKFARHIANTVISKFKDVKGKEIKLEEYIPIPK